MDTTRLFRLLARRCRGQLLGIFASNKLPRVLPMRRPLLLVCNTDPDTRPGEHWVVIYLGKDGYGEYFDSFGNPPMDIFRKYLDRHCTRWTRNFEQLQSALSAFCGHYCVFYCLFKILSYSLNSIVNCFSHDTALNDYMVHKFVCDNL